MLPSRRQIAQISIDFALALTAWLTAYVARFNSRSRLRSQTYLHVESITVFSLLQIAGSCSRRQLLKAVALHIAARSQTFAGRSRGGHLARSNGRHGPARALFSAKRRVAGAAIHLHDLDLVVLESRAEFRAKARAMLIADRSANPSSS